MAPVVIENPILNPPFSEPTRHFRFSEDGITDQIVEDRRESGYFLPIASPRKRDGQLKFETEWLETAIYLTEVAGRYGDPWIENELRDENVGFNNGLPRLAFKMATGSGKTVVMAMLIAWQALNKLENRQDRRFSDAFLIVAPGITIRDRLRVLLPSDPSNYYRERDLLPLTFSSGSVRPRSSSPTTTRSCCASAGTQPNSPRAS